MYFVTVSEMLGSGGEKVARRVAEALKYPFYGKEELFKAAHEMGYLSDVSHLELKSPHLLEKYFSDKPKIYLDRFQSVIYAVATKGNALFFGKGSQLLLHNFACALHVLITGTLENQRIVTAPPWRHGVAARWRRGGGPSRGSSCASNSSAQIGQRHPHPPGPPGQ